MTWKLIKALFFILFFASIALAAFAYIGPIFMPDAFSSANTEIRVPLELNMSK